MAKSLLVDKFGIDKNGNRTHKKVIANKPVSNAKETPTKVKQVNPKEPAKPQWYDSMSGLGLTRLPVGIPKEDVKIHVDITNPTELHTKCVMSWKDPKSGRVVMIYTKEFLNRNALVKWDKMKNINSGTISTIKEKALNDVLKGSNDKFKQAGAIMSIIAHTGLRVGQTKMLEITGNKGVSTMHPDDISIDKENNISINFVGKSYKENTATISGQPELAKYLKKLKASKKDSDRLFDIDRTFVDAVLKKKYGFKDLKIKDMRTYVGTDSAKEHLMSDVDDIKNSLTGDKRKDQKLLRDRLQSTYEYVANVLNNTPKMAETAYIHPAVRLSWLKMLNINPDDLNKSEYDFITFDEILADSAYNELTQFGIPPLDAEWEEECGDEYDLFPFEELKEEKMQKYTDILENEVVKFAQEMRGRYNVKKEKEDSAKLLKKSFDDISEQDSIVVVHEKLVKAKNCLLLEDMSVKILFNGAETNSTLSALSDRLEKAISSGINTESPMGIKLQSEEINPEFVKYNTIGDLVRLNGKLLENKAKAAYKEKYNEDYNL